MSDKVTNDDDFQNQNENRMDKEKAKKLFKENIYSGITVALVSLPLSTALAMAQGATPMMGLSTAVWGPGIQGIIGGSNYNILGPAGALVNIVNTLKTEADTSKIIPWVALVAGILSFIVYAVKFENYCTMLPSSVLEGFSLGVATTIGLSQVDFAFGLKCPGKVIPKHKEFYMRVYETFTNLHQTEMKEFLTFLPYFVVLMSLLKWKPSVPWIIVIAAIGVIHGVIMQEGVNDKNYTPYMLRDEYTKLQEWGNIELWNFGYWTPEKEIDKMLILSGAFKVAFVAVLETLISARIADNKTNTRFDQSQEVFGMSIANMVCGLFGGTPCTGVLIRTNVNVQTGATHKTSQFINAVFVLFTVCAFMPIFSYIPFGVIAAILITSACRLVPKTIMRQLWNVDKFEFWILIITWLICVFFDGAVGLMIGAFLSFLKQSEKTSESRMHIENDEKTMQIQLDGSLDYINCLDFETKIFDKINQSDIECVSVDLSKTIFVDIDGLFVLSNLFKKKGVDCVMVYEGLGKDENSVLCKSELYKKLKSESKVFTSMEEAVASQIKTKEV